MKKRKSGVVCPCDEVEYSISWLTDGNYELAFCPFCGLAIDESEPDDEQEDLFSDDE